jgi:membrane protease YdiL (CAAX protease family)
MNFVNLIEYSFYIVCAFYILKKRQKLKNHLPEILAFPLIIPLLNIVLYIYGIRVGDGNLSSLIINLFFSYFYILIIYSAGKISQDTIKKDFNIFFIKTSMKFYLGVFIFIVLSIYTVSYMYYFGANLIPNNATALKLNDIFSFHIVISFLIFAIIEEILYRMALQNMLLEFFRKLSIQRGASSIAILTSAFFWSIAHFGQSQNDFMKFLQIFPIGILLGLTNLHLGLRVGILFHVMFSIIASLSLLIL